MNHVIIVTYITVRIISQFLTISPLLSFALLVEVFSQEHSVSFNQFSIFFMPHSMPFLLYHPRTYTLQKRREGPELLPSHCNESKTDFNRICPLWTTFIVVNCDF